MMFKSRMDIIRYLAFMKNLAFFIKNDLFKKDTEGEIGVLFYRDKAYCITNHMLAVTESPGTKLTRPIFWSYNEANLIEGEELLDNMFNLNFCGHPQKLTKLNAEVLLNDVCDMDKRYSEEYLFFLRSSFDDMISYFDGYTQAKLAKLTACISMQMGTMIIKVCDRRNHSEIINIFEIESQGGNIDFVTQRGHSLSLLYLFSILSFGLSRHNIISIKILEKVFIFFSGGRYSKRRTKFIVAKESCKNFCNYK